MVEKYIKRLTVRINKTKKYSGQRQTTKTAKYLDVISPSELIYISRYSINELKSVKQKMNTSINKRAYDIYKNRQKYL